MQIRLTCQCGQVIHVDGSEGDSTFLCPACGRVLAAPVGPGATDAANPPAPAAVTPSPASPLPPPRATPPPIPLQPVAPAWPAAPIWQVGSSVPPPPPPWMPPAPPRRPGRGLGMAAMIVGILSCLPCCIACGFSGLVLGVVAIGLSVRPVLGKSGGRGYGIAGLVLGLAGIAMGLVPMGLLGMGMIGSRGTPFSRKPPMPTPKAITMPSLPAVLTAQDVTAALTGPLVRVSDSDRASAELRRAVAAFPRRGNRDGDLARCVQAFRLHLAFAQRQQPEKDEHARMFQTAGQELVDQVLEQYRKAGDLEHDGQWSQAQAAYEDVLRLLPDRTNQVAANVREHQDYCRRQAVAKAAAESARPGKPRPARYEAEPSKGGGRAPSGKDF